MKPDQDPSQLEELPWLVHARNGIQSLMLNILEHWDAVKDEDQRRHLVAAAFSLWRAVFLLVKRGQTSETIDHVDAAAKQFLDRVIRTNAITFGDDLLFRRWSSVYYVENAIARIYDLTGYKIEPRGWSPPGRVRDVWDEAFEELSKFVADTLSGTPGAALENGANGRSA